MFAQRILARPIVGYGSLLLKLFSIGCTPQGNRDFIEALTKLLRSHADFLLAELGLGGDLVERAGNLMVCCDNRLASIRELVEACVSHTWNGLIYEAWVWETAHRVRQLMQSIDPTSARALKLYAQYVGYYELDTSAMQDALYEAKRALEGDPYLSAVNDS